MKRLWRYRNHTWCPVCGLFGFKAALAKRRHDEEAHIRWAHSLLGRAA